jgi:hypothetical protein
MRLPSPAWIVAVIALFGAFSTTATAALLVTGANIKNGTVTGLDVKESSLAKVPNADKLDGFDSSQLIPGGVLPSKKTIRGTYGLSFYADVPGQAGLTTWSFGVMLPSAPLAPAGNFIKAGQGPTAKCPGSPADPQAAPGNLCIYESLASNVEAGATMFRFGSPAPNAADRFGVGLRKFSTGTGAASTFGTWAVTAP